MDWVLGAYIPSFFILHVIWVWLWMTYMLLLFIYQMKYLVFMRLMQGPLYKRVWSYDLAAHCSYYFYQVWYKDVVLYINCTLCLFCVILIKYDLVVFTIVIQTVECPLSLCIVTFHNLVQLFMVVTCVFCIRRVPRLLFFYFFIVNIYIWK